jgi:outer membrane immunogenic protein
VPKQRSADLGSVGNNFVSTAYPFQGTFRTSSRVTDDIVRIGVNYYFGGTVLAN